MNTAEDPLEQFPLNDPEFDPEAAAPFVGQIVRGEIPGVIITKEDIGGPAMAPLEGNGRALFTKAGLVMAPTSVGAALFNPDVIGLKDIKALDESGALTQVLPPVGSLAPGADTTGQTSEPTERAPIPMSGPVQSAPMAPKAQKTLARGRLDVLGTGAKPPTSTGNPSSRILAQLRANPV